MPEVRLIDANALIKDIAESIRLADEWEKESHEKKDKHGLKCATDTRRSLMAMLSRVKEFPTIEAEPVRHGRWVYAETIGGMKHYYCTSCKELSAGNECYADENQILWFGFCPKCGAKMKMDGGEKR